MSASTDVSRLCDRTQSRRHKFHNAAMWSQNYESIVNFWTTIAAANRECLTASAAQIALAAMFTTSASSAALKKNETMPWAVTVRRVGLDATATSET